MFGLYVGVFAYHKACFLYVQLWYVAKSLSYIVFECHGNFRSSISWLYLQMLLSVVFILCFVMDHFSLLLCLVGATWATVDAGFVPNDLQVILEMCLCNLFI